MKLEEIDITFGSSVLVEKIQKTEFLHIINSLCKDVFGSFLHINISRTGWVTIIRYSKLKTDFSEDYCLLRIICLKRTDTSSSHKLHEKILRELLFFNSTRKEAYCAIFEDVVIIDTTPIICNKELLAPIIHNLIECAGKSTESEGKNIFELLNISSLSEKFHFTYPDRITHCVSLYGNYDDIIDERQQNLNRRFFEFSSPEITKSSFKALERKVNNWKAQIKRKGRRALKKSLILKPI